MNRAGIFLWIWNFVSQSSLFCARLDCGRLTLPEEICQKYQFREGIDMLVENDPLIQYQFQYLKS